MKNKTIFALLISFFSFAQDTIICTVKYKVNVIENKESALEKNMLELNKNAFNIINEFTFNLDISKNKALFYLEDKLYSDEQAKKIGLLKLKYTGENIQSNDSVFKLFNFGDKKKLIGKEKNKSWNITSEKKLINGFVCYKATLIDTITNIKGNFQFPVEAWFCSEFPYSFGPLYFGGLPGLIFELQTKDGVFGVESINFHPVKNTLIKHQKSEIISEQKAIEIIKNKQEDE